MRVLFATSECASLYKRGGLGDVSHSLPITLQKFGVHIVVTLPFYNEITGVKNPVNIGPLAVDFSGKRELVYLFKTTIPNTKVPVILFRHKRLTEYNETAFLFYSCCIASLYRQAQGIVGLPFDIIHCNDWHTALAPLLLGEENKRYKEKGTITSFHIRSILTIHNILYQGILPVGVVKDTGIPESVFHPTDRYINVLREGLEHVDVVSTVSPSYAKEILSPSYGPHVYAALRKRGDEVIGILNGIDEESWNPKNDRFLPVQYDRRTVEKGKAAIKKKLQDAVGLPVNNNRLLFGFVGRIEPNQKGIDLLMKTVRSLPDKDFQVVILGTGNKKQMKQLKTLDKEYTHIAYIDTFDERLARRIYGGSDCLLVPSKFEPCGLIQMIAMRYGTIPIVRKTGGLADSVVDGKTGFVFSDYDVDDLRRAMWKAIVKREDDPKGWLAMVKHVMTKDFSWKASARQYAALYKKLLS